jgi:hypothetical protein
MEVKVILKSSNKIKQENVAHIDHKAPSGGARESTQGAKGICNLIGGITL